MTPRLQTLRQAIHWQGPGWFVGIVAVYFVGWTPLLAQLVVNDGRSPLLVGAAFLALFVGVLWLNQRAPRWLHIALLIPYYLVLLTFHVVFGYLARWMDPTYFLISLIISLSLLIPIFGRRFRPIILVIGFVLAALIASLDARAVGGWLFVAGLATIPLGAWFMIWLCRADRLKHVSSAALVFFLFSLMIYPRGGVNYKFIFPGHVAQVLAQPGIEAIYDYRDPANAERMCSQVMYLARAPESSLFIGGPQNPCRHLLRIDERNLASTKRLDIFGRGNDNIVFDPQDANLFYIGTVDEILRCSVEPFQVLERYKLKESIHNLNFLHYDPTEDRLFVSYDFAPAVSILDRATLNQIATIPCPDNARTHDLWFDPPVEQVMVSSTFFFGWRVDTYDLKTLAHKNAYRWPWDIGFHFTTVDPRYRRAFLGSTATGELRILNLDTLAWEKSLQLEPGLRNHNFDRQRGLALVGNYFKGILHVIDSRTLTEIGRLYLGPRLRWVQIDEQTGEWYCTSGAGGFRIIPEKALNLPTSMDDQ
ncbi:MAG TPA: hypothetical protein PKW95_04380 [bacterium]|nr:hypothetical protein [bacterium]